MRRFVVEQNILRYERALLESMSDDKRAVVLRLLEQARQELAHVAEEVVQPARSKHDD